MSIPNSVHYQSQTHNRSSRYNSHIRLDKIIIDPIRCPNAAREFNDYEIEMDRDGNLRGEFPDRNNHTIDAVRYAIENEILMKKARAGKRRF